MHWAQQLQAAATGQHLVEGFLGGAFIYHFLQPILVPKLVDQMHCPREHRHQVPERSSGLAGTHLGIRLQSLQRTFEGQDPARQCLTFVCVPLEILHHIASQLASHGVNTGCALRIECSGAHYVSELVHTM